MAFVISYKHAISSGPGSDAPPPLFTAALFDFSEEAILKLFYALYAPHAYCNKVNVLLISYGATKL